MAYTNRHGPVHEREIDPGPASRPGHRRRTHGPAARSKRSQHPADLDRGAPAVAGGSARPLLRLQPRGCNSLPYRLSTADTRALILFMFRTLRFGVGRGVVRGDESHWDSSLSCWPPRAAEVAAATTPP